MKCWGRSDGGRLGNDSSVSGTSTPVDVFGLDNGVVEIYSSGLMRCALLNIGEIKCWGPKSGSVIDESSLSITRANQLTPENVTGLVGNVERFIKNQESAFPCFILDNGTIKCQVNNRSHVIGMRGFGDGLDEADTRTDTDNDGENDSIDLDDDDDGVLDENDAFPKDETQS